MVSHVHGDDGFDAGGQQSMHGLRQASGLGLFDGSYRPALCLQTGTGAGEGILVTVTI
jgi:hypothetical protein